MGAPLGIALALAVSAFFVFKIRHVLPVGVIKLGVSMFQVGAGALLLVSQPVHLHFFGLEEGSGEEDALSSGEVGWRALGWQVVVVVVCVCMCVCVCVCECECVCRDRYQIP